MARINEYRSPSAQAVSAGSARALVILLVLAAFLAAPFIARAGKPQNASAPHIAQVVSNPSKTNKGCPKKSLSGQPSACASSSVPVAGFDNRVLTPAPIVRGSSLPPLYELTLTTQCCGAPPDRPPRFAA